MNGISRPVEGKVAIVTGSASGIGRAAAFRLAQQGVRVVINDICNAEEAGATLRAIHDIGAQAVFVQADVADDGACRALAQQAIETWGQIDILVNNAGTTRFANHSDLEALDEDDFLDVYRTNLVGAYQMVRACAPAMRAAGRGAVVNVSSLAGVTGFGSSIAYAASKGALNTMTLSLARALAPQIRVNCVCPAFVASQWYANQVSPEQWDAMVKMQIEDTPLARVGTPEDVAVSIAFFCGEGADHITGEMLMVDAGTHLNTVPLAMR